MAAVLEATRSCDTVLFMWSLQDSIDETGEKLYSCLFAQGLPSTVHVVMVTQSLIPMHCNIKYTSSTNGEDKSTVKSYCQTFADRF